MPTTYAIPNGRTVMDATLYTGTGAAQNITNQAGFKPDLVWTKSRNNAVDNCLIDSVRGTSIALKSNLSNAEDNAGAPYYVTSFNTNGFGVNQGTGSGASGYTYVGWQWQAGQGTTSSNTNGSITSTVSVNANAGFSIVSYTGTGSSATVGHGLGVAPSMIIVKCRSASGSEWVVWVNGFTVNDLLQLSATAGKQTVSNYWGSNLPSSTVFSLPNASYDNNKSSQTMIAYCFAEVAGYSKFGSFVGNGSTDNVFVYTGFRPRFLMIKASSNADNWFMFDTARNSGNITNNFLCPNLSNAESQDNFFDLLSNGFKFRLAGNYTYIYAAFAEHPFKYSLAR